MKPLRINAEIVLRSADQTQQLKDDASRLYLHRLREPGTIAMASKATGISTNRVLAVRRDQICSLLIYELKKERCEVTGDIAHYYASYQPDEKMKGEAPK